jgi:hypothetical protein
VPGLAVRVEDARKTQLLHAEAECKTDGVKEVRKNAEAGRETRKARGLQSSADVPTTLTLASLIA